MHYFEHWTVGKDIDNKQCKDGQFDKLTDLILVEQLLELTPVSLQLWLKERDPKTSEDLVKMADHYLATHKTHGNWEGKTQDRDSSEIGKSSKKENKSSVTGNLGDKKCFKCGKRGHIAVNCRVNTNFRGKYAKDKAYRCLGYESPEFYIEGKIDGKRALMLRDTGCSQTMVHEKLVPKGKFTGRDIDIQLPYGSFKQVRTAHVTVEARDGKKEIEIGVISTLPEDVL